MLEPFSGDYRFRDQIRASAGSISDNIAEGFERGGNKEFIQFLYIAKGSCGETRNQAYRAFDSGYITVETLNDLLSRTTEINQGIGNFIKYLKTAISRGRSIGNNSIIQ